VNIANQLFHQSVPILSYLQWQVLAIDRGFTQTLLPLSVESSNQYMTQQAALMLLAADYTGGIALSTLFNDVPIIGFHPMIGDYGAYMWGAKANIKWYGPSAGDLICKATIPEDKWGKLARRFFVGKDVVITIPVFMQNGDDLVAKADFTYWAKHSHALRETARDESKTHILYAHKVKTSAQLIAGLRALNDKPSDPFAEQVASKQGVILAKKFCITAPQLRKMVAARTEHCDRSLTLFAKKHPSFSIVNIGVGLDTRLYRLKSLNNICTVYDLDLPIMLSLRKDMFKDTDKCNFQVHSIAIDLRENVLEQRLLKAGFDPMQPTFFIWEGGSMYFYKDDASHIFTGTRKLMQHRGSRLWLDYTSQEVVANQTNLEEIESFMSNMRRMGEPFIQGYKNILDGRNSDFYELKHLTSSGYCVCETDAVYDHYRFCILGPKSHDSDSDITN